MIFRYGENIKVEGRRLKVEGGGEVIEVVEVS